jgi:hypothetical protein
MRKITAQGINQRKLGLRLFAMENEMPKIKNRDKRRKGISVLK